MENIEQKGWGKVFILNDVISITSINKVISEQRLEGRRISHMAIWEEEVVQRPWGRSVLPCAHKSKETGVPGPDCRWRRTEGLILWATVRTPDFTLREIRSPWRFFTWADLYFKSIIQSAVLKIDYRQTRAAAGRPVGSRLQWSTWDQLGPRTRVLAQRCWEMFGFWMHPEGTDNTISYWEY